MFNDGLYLLREDIDRQRTCKSVQGAVLDGMDADTISVADATHYLGTKVSMIDNLGR